MPNLRGQLLIASPRLSDPNFIRTVVLMVQHGDEGALGLVLNRPLETTVADVCEKLIEGPCRADGPLLQGGPCEGPLMVLHAHQARSDLEVVSGVHFTTDREKIEWLLGNAEADEVRCFVGYAGWGAGQLEAELETGSWLCFAGQAQHVFGPNDRLWSKLTTSLVAGEGLLEPDDVPDDPSMN